LICVPAAYNFSQTAIVARPREIRRQKRLHSHDRGELGEKQVAAARLGAPQNAINAKLKNTSPTRIKTKTTARQQ